MYTNNRLEWHQGEEDRSINPSVSCGGSCQSIKRGFCLSSIALLLLTPRAKIHQSELRGFFLLADRVTHDTLLALHGVTSQTTPHLDTPRGQRRTALIERLLKHLVHGGNKARCISESIRQAHLGSFVFKSNKRLGAGRIEMHSIHPW